MEKLLNIYLKTGGVVTLEQFIYLYLIYNKDYELADKLLSYEGNWDEIWQLSDRGFVKITNLEFKFTSEDVILRKEGEDLFKDLNTNSSIKRTKELVETFRNLFPPGSNRSGYRYRGDKHGCSIKLNKFIRDNPEWTNKEILQATTNYVNKFKPYYEGMRQAHYFIEKSGTSDLLGELEGLNEVVETTISSINEMK